MTDHPVVTKCNLLGYLYTPRAPPGMTDRDRLIVKGFGKMDRVAMPFLQRATIAQTVQQGEAEPPPR